MVIEDGKIIEVGDFLPLSKNNLDVREINYPCVLLPGFIDSHTHVCYYGNRSDEYAKRNSGISYQQILEEGGGIHNTMNSTSNSTDEQLIDDTLVDRNKFNIKYVDLVDYQFPEDYIFTEDDAALVSLLVCLFVVHLFP